MRPKAGGWTGCQRVHVPDCAGLGGCRSPSPNRITLLRDRSGDGLAKTRSTFLQGLNSPFGMTLVGHDLYVANTDAVMRFPYADGDTQITAAGIKVVDLPAGPINHHWTKNFIASPDGSRLYVTVGSNSNVGENGLDKEDERAAILEINPGTGKRVCLLPDCAIPMAWPGNPKPARFGRR